MPVVAWVGAGDSADDRIVGRLLVLEGRDAVAQWRGVDVCGSVVARCGCVW